MTERNGARPFADGRRAGFSGARQMHPSGAAVSVAFNHVGPARVGPGRSRADHWQCIAALDSSAVII
jgi:hypothetical protein